MLGALPTCTIGVKSRTASYGSFCRLGPIECKLAEIFLRHPGQVLSRDRLMDQVWGLEFEGESNVLEVYIYHLRAKLEADGLPRLIHTVRGVGYAFRE